jgi:hypothetical protein
MSNDIPPELIEQLNKGYCVLFVGDELDGQSQSKRLATALADRGQLHGACPVPECQKQGCCALPGRCALPWHRVAQLYQSRRGRNELVRFVRDFVEEHYPPQPVLPVFRAVAGLPAPVMITTACDR